MELFLKSYHSIGQTTLGKLYRDGAFECYILEDVVREIPGKPVSDWKVPGKTAIPAGRYKVVITFSNRFKKPLPLLVDVPGFSGVRVHPGNTHQDTEGCLLPGTSCTATNVRGSRQAFTRLMAALTATTEDVWLTIERADQHS